MVVPRSSPVSAEPAIAGHRIDGFVSRCACGLLMRSTVAANVEADRRGHAEWHAAKAAPR